eukprot:215313_1
MEQNIDIYSLYALTLVCFGVCVLVFIIIIANVTGINICLTTIEYNTPVKSVQYLSILSLLSFLICLASQIYIIQSMNGEYQVPDHNIYELIVACTNIIAWTLGQLFIYFLFIANLHHTFKNTVLQISKSIIITLCIFVITFFISRLAYVAFYILYYMSIISSSKFAVNASIFVLVTEFFDFILSVCLVYIFVNRLFK